MAEFLFSSPPWPNFVGYAILIKHAEHELLQQIHRSFFHDGKGHACSKLLKWTFIQLDWATTMSSDQWGLGVTNYDWLNDNVIGSFYQKARIKQLACLFQKMRRSNILRDIYNSNGGKRIIKQSLCTESLWGR